jgi:hypothetical protein
MRGNEDVLLSCPETKKMENAIYEYEMVVCK